MFSIILIAILPASSLVYSSSADDVPSLLATIEALQQPIEDFQCEFEGTEFFRGPVAAQQKVGADGVADLFGGTFLWRHGDLHSEIMHRKAPDQFIVRESVVIRRREVRAEQVTWVNDAAIPVASIMAPKDIDQSGPGNLGQIFLTDYLKQLATDFRYELRISDDVVDGHPLKALDVGIAGVPDSDTGRYWIDLRRSGHVVRAEGYGPGKTIISRLDIKLARFKVGEVEVWMPVNGEYASYAAFEKGSPVLTKEPTVLSTVNVLQSTIQFNKRPGPEAFTLKYKPGTPVSDHLRQMTYEFGRQTIGLRPTKVDAERTLNEQVAQAEVQNKLLIAAPSQHGDWWSWMIWGFVGFALVGSIGLWLRQRRLRAG